MKQPMSRADLPAVSTGSGDSETRGQAVARRFEALGYSDREWHELTGIARKTLNRAIEDDPNMRESTWTAIEAKLDQLEAVNRGEAVAMERPRGFVEDEHGGVVRIRLENVFGATSAVVEAPADNPDALAAALDILMRRQGVTDEQPDPGNHP